MSDPFLKEQKVKDEARALTKSIRAALQRNETYEEDVSNKTRKEFRLEWGNQVLAESSYYTKAAKTSAEVSDDQHCSSIERISVNMNKRFGHILVGKHMRFGTSQKAFNLYLKYLWLLKKTELPPPHCPVDGIVLKEGNISGSWTKCDSKEEYLAWITLLRKRAAPLSLSAWEYNIWNQRM